MVIHRRIGLGEIAAEMDAARFLALEGGRDHQPGDDQHVLHGPAGGVVRIPAAGCSGPSGRPASAASFNPAASRVMPMRRHMSARSDLLRSSRSIRA